MERLYRQSSFGACESPGGVSLTKEFERKILSGGVFLANLHQDETCAIDYTLQALIDNIETPKAQISERPGRGAVDNHVIATCSVEYIQQLEQRFVHHWDASAVSRRNQERAEAQSVANVVQYVPHEVDYMSKFTPELRESIMSTFVSLVVDHLQRSQFQEEMELPKWGTEFLKRLGKLLMIQDLVLEGLIKPVKQYSELRELGILLDDMSSGNTTTHLHKIKRELAQMQPEIDKLFQQTVASMNFSGDDRNESSSSAASATSDAGDDDDDDDDEDSARTVESVTDVADVAGGSVPGFRGGALEDLQGSNHPFTSPGTCSASLDGSGVSRVSFDSSSGSGAPQTDPRGHNHQFTASDAIRVQGGASGTQSLSQCASYALDGSGGVLDVVTPDANVSTTDADASRKKSLPSMLMGSLSRRFNKVLTIARPTILGNDPSTTKGEFTEKVDFLKVAFSQKGDFQSRDHLDRSNALADTENDDYEDGWSADDGFDVSGVNLDEPIPEVPPSACTILVRYLVTGYILTGHNDARVQLLFNQFAAFLGVSEYTVMSLENYIAGDLVGALTNSTAEDTTRKMTRNLKIAAVTVSGGALLAFTAGVLAPALAAGIAMLGLGGGGVGALLGTSEGTNFLVSFFGVGGSDGLTNWKAPRKLASLVPDFSFSMLHSHLPRSLAVGICIDGLAAGADSASAAAIQTWESGFPSPLCDLYLCRWHAELLKSLGGMIQKLTTQPWSNKCLKLWSLYASDSSVPMSGIQWPLGLVQYASNFDKVWLVARNCAAAAGEVLSQALLDKAIGERPVSLVGYGMGARTIFYALLKLYKKKRHSTVKDVVLMGLPSSAGLEQWQQVSSVVAGRLINVYSRSDWIMAFAYRYMDSNANLAGLAPVQCHAVENWDATKLVQSQANYVTKLRELAALIHYDL